MEDKKMEYEEYEEKMSKKTTEELKEETIRLVKEKLGDREEMYSTEFDKMLDIHMIMNFAKNEFYEIEFLNEQVLVEHYYYKKFVIKRIK